VVDFKYGHLKYIEVNDIIIMKDCIAVVKVRRHLTVSAASNEEFNLKNVLYSVNTQLYTSKGKVISLQAWSGPEGSRKLMLPDFMTKAQDGVKIVNLTHQPPLPPGNVPDTHFC